VVAPLAGTVVPLDEVPDPVFSGAVIGPGLAILPDEPDAALGVRVVVVSPCSGRLLSVYPHAVVVGVDNERAVLVHLGVDTEDLASACFDVVVTEGDMVEAGQPLLAWSPGCVREEGRSTLCPIVALQADTDDVAMAVEPGERVAEGQVLLAWA
jgi:phosphotransferase system IIA component